MAYLDAPRRPASPALVAAALVHAAIGWALLTGASDTPLARTVPELRTFAIRAEQKTKPKRAAPRRTAPPTALAVSLAYPVEMAALQPGELLPIDILSLLDGDGTTTATDTPSPLTPPAPSVGTSAQALGDKSRWITGADYPRAALRQRDQGIVTIRAQIEIDGHVRACGIVQSSGYADLDEAACRGYALRALFTPATDAGGAPVVSTIDEQILWRIPRRS